VGVEEAAVALEEMAEEVAETTVTIGIDGASKRR